MTYTSPTTGQPVGLSFLMPQSVADLERCRTMMAHWAWASCGMMGRRHSTCSLPPAGAADYFAQNRPEFKHNVLNYYAFLREQDDPHPRLGEPATAPHARPGGHPA